MNYDFIHYYFSVILIDDILWGKIAQARIANVGVISDMDEQVESN